MKPICEVCGNELADWQGNVCTLTDFLFADVSSIPLLKVFCKECTIFLDSRPETRLQWHAIWELDWLRDNPELCWKTVRDDAANNKRWSALAQVSLLQLTGYADLRA